MNIFRANDIRGLYGRELSDLDAYKIARAFVHYTRAKDVIVGRDCRLSSPALARGLIRGLIEQGANVINLDLIDTPGLYFATCIWKCPGIMITASHNPANENGFYLCDAMAKPINEKSGLRRIETLVKKNKFARVKKIGSVGDEDIVDEYIRHLLSFVNLNKIKKLHFVADAGNGMGGWIAPLIYGKLPFKVDELYFKPDGKFPNRSPNTAAPGALRVLQEEVIRNKAQFGVAFDGDADRAAFVDERGNVVEGSVIGALISAYLLKKSKRSKVVYSSTCSKILPETIKLNHGTGIMAKVGHTFVQQAMASSRAVFGAENTGHYFYKSNWYADSGIITSLVVCQIFSEFDGAFSEMIKPYKKYFRAEETFLLSDKNEDVLAQFRKLYKNRDEFDGIFVDMGEYWFSVRESKTEPVVRLMVEGRNEELVLEKLEFLATMIKSKINSGGSEK